MWRKGREKMRFALDCRASNRHFIQAPSTELLSSEGFSRIELDLETSDSAGPILDQLLMHLGIADVKDCFHRMRLDRCIHEYFCYEGGAAAEFGGHRDRRSSRGAG